MIHRASHLPLLMSLLGLLAGLLHEGCSTVSQSQPLHRLPIAITSSSVQLCPIILGIQAITADGPLNTGPGISQHTSVIASFLFKAHGQFFLVDGGLPSPSNMPLALNLLGGHPAYVLPTRTDVLTQLTAAGFNPSALSFLAITHAHGDHAGIAERIPDIPLITTSEEATWLSRMPPPESDLRTWRTVSSWNRLQPRIRLISWDNRWENSSLPTMNLFGDGSVIFIHTPGHTPGSMSILLATSPNPTLLLGDAALTEKSARDNIPTGILNKFVDSNPSEAERTLAAISSVVKNHPNWVIHTGHDEQLLKTRHQFTTCVRGMMAP